VVVLLSYKSVPSIQKQRPLREWWDYFTQRGSQLWGMTTFIYACVALFLFGSAQDLQHSPNRIANVILGTQTVKPIPPVGKKQKGVLLKKQGEISLIVKNH
jgi:hypothetical protein